MENNNIEKTGQAIGWLEKLLELGRKYSLKDWAEVFLIIFIAGIFVLVWSNPGRVINFFQKAAQKNHIELLEKRQATNYEAQRICEKLLYQNGADRVLVLENHNSLVGVGGIPFLKTSATVESLNDSISPVSNQYQQVNLSLIPFSDYLYGEGFWAGETRSMSALDKSLAYRMMSNGTEYFAGAVIQGTDKALGFILVSYCGSNRPEDILKLKDNILKASLQLGVLLELRERH